jgi:hypothetical protein
MTLPVISLVTDQRYWDDQQIGIMTNNTSESRVDWRRPVNIEYFETPKSESLLNQLGEVRVQGVDGQYIIRYVWHPYCDGNHPSVRHLVYA